VGIPLLLLCWYFGDMYSSTASFQNMHVVRQFLGGGLPQRPGISRGALFFNAISASGAGARHSNLPTLPRIECSGTIVEVQGKVDFALLD
jgi:hypothetical protein